MHYEHHQVLVQMHCLVYQVKQSPLLPSDEAFLGKVRVTSQNSFLPLSLFIELFCWGQTVNVLMSLAGLIYWH